MVRISIAMTSKMAASKVLYDKFFAMLWQFKSCKVDLSFFKVGLWRTTLDVRKRYHLQQELMVSKIIYYFLP